MSFLNRVFQAYQSGDFWEDPLPFDEFIRSPVHMNHPGLTPKQLEPFEGLFGKDPKQAFSKNRKHKVAAIVWSKGSGKDLSASILQNWIFYLLLCMRSPTKYFGFPGTEESIDIVNVATNYTQAKLVFFDRFTARIRKWPWLRRNYTLIESGRVLNSELKDSRGEIRILESSIKTSNSIRFHSLHTNSGGWEGFNILGFTMDEASEFETELIPSPEDPAVLIKVSKADSIYNTLRSSAVSRTWPWYGVLISYPRQAEDFMLRKYEESKLVDSDILGFREFAWNVLPSWKYPSPLVEWQGFQIPEQLLADAEANPAFFKTAYLLSPPTARAAWFYNEQKVHDVFSETRFPLVNSDRVEVPATEGKYVGNVIYIANNLDEYQEYYLHGDYSVDKDRAVLLVAHPEWLPDTLVYKDPLNAIEFKFKFKVIVDAVLIWEPDKLNGIQVSYSNMASCLDLLYERFQFKRSSFDQLQSAFTIETLKLRDKKVEKHNINTDDYITLRSLVNSGLVSSFPHDLLKAELLNLTWTGKRVDHTATSSKDIADCLAGVARLMLLNPGSPSVHYYTNTGESSQHQDQPIPLYEQQTYLEI